VDALGNPLRWLLTGGEVADISQARTLIEGLSTAAVMGDKGYDADALIAYMQAMGAEAVIPLRSHRTEHRAYDRHAYKDRNLVERFFSRLKQFRRVATRDDTLARHFVSLLTLGCAYSWLAYLLTGPRHFSLIRSAIFKRPCLGVSETSAEPLRSRPLRLERRSFEGLPWVQAVLWVGCYTSY
jgi:transposase